MAELVDAPDSKSGGGDTVWVRFPLRAQSLERILVVGRQPSIAQGSGRIVVGGVATQALFDAIKSSREINGTDLDADENIQILGSPRLRMKCNCVSAYDQILNVVVVEFG